jgi:hypothetical protein
MKFRKPSAELIETFEAVFPGPPAVARKMFGFPAGFVNGNMFMGLHQEDMVLRLPEEPRTELMQKKDWKTFEPMPGHPMREYVVVPPAVLGNRKELGAWVAKALEYGASLAPKAKTVKRGTVKGASGKGRKKPSAK